jgi:hypothetical protein
MPRPALTTRLTSRLGRTRSFRWTIPPVQSGGGLCFRDRSFYSRSSPTAAGDRSNLTVRRATGFPTAILPTSGSSLLASHDFTDKTELAAEIFDQQDANSVGGIPKQRETIFDIGGRQALNKNNSLLLLMGGRSLQGVTRLNGQPDWIAYVGFQLLLGHKANNPQVEKTVPVEQLHPR